ncbi:hypothetical protein HRR83_006911 [Exophiala dermatitidis]|uniref:Uncharacterized protein n=1 Tax=Exophiala dermatitidis TaxID=5970 RepID=A0AAN6ETP1_EXODE|nr:hypothetical protein HRR73_005950 [Exophiala dermatitidis]KAJ4542535.1 hypothetical protein HRR77_005733 [Exophiala dermatitidis]KAJ4548224.1 hypothetical protein HRR76_000831 [Exophiala dermatitidis]KAJ4578493.1 hypothetical protein HRR79_001793 [Exophiala dermatitidis]KAJ4579884.1 hypothetical protein HRR81_002047 [Exophiala dermatitidis]
MNRKAQRKRYVGLGQQPRQINPVFNLTTFPPRRPGECGCGSAVLGTRLTEQPVASLRQVGDLNAAQPTPLIKKCSRRLLTLHFMNSSCMIPAIARGFAVNNGP